MEVASYFELAPAKAREIAAAVGMAVSAWRKVAAKLGLTTGEVDRMASAFEHDDLAAATHASRRRRPGSKGSSGV